MKKNTKEKLGTFDKLRKANRYLNAGLLGVGILTGSAGLIGAFAIDYALDKTVGKSISDKLKGKKKK